MEEWKTDKIENLLDALIDYRGKTPQKVNQGIPLITAKIVKGGRIDTPEEFVAYDDYDSWMRRGYPEIGDVVLTTEAPLGEVAQISYLPVALAQRIVTLRGKEGILDSTYLKYFLQSEIGQKRLSARETGTTVTGIKQSELRKVEITYPSFPTQRKIASILKSIDDKIELNNRINHNLEEQAQALYKSWFVDFEPFKGRKFIESELGMIPEGWSIYKLEDLMEIRRGSSPRPIQSFLSDSGLRWLKISDATSTVSPFVFSIQAHIRPEGLKNTILRKEGTLVLSNSATPGLPKFLGVDTCIHDGWLYFENSKLSNEFMYLLFNHFRQDLISQANGSVFMNLKTDILKQMKIAIPCQCTLNAFDNVVKSVFQNIKSKCQEINILINERDGLLPRLMSGEITC